MNLTPRRVALFFTRGVSLRTWRDVGMLDREVALYRRLRAAGVRSTFVTYGDESDSDVAAGIPEIDAIWRRAGDPLPSREDTTPWVTADAMAAADLIKTNQTCGAEAALAVARRFGKPLVARCGYMWSQFAAWRQGLDSSEAQEARRVEAEVFSAADAVVVTTEAMRDDVARRVPQARSRVRVVPNYVDTDVFAPGVPRRGPRRRLVYVGRLEQPQKNVRAMVEAIRGVDVELEVIGNGPMRDELARASAEVPGLCVRGSVPNDALANVLRGADAFVLPSFYEGHPKALLEAMACGLPVVTTDTPGIREVVQHGRTGWLCGTDADSLRAGIQTVLGDAALADALGQNAREYVMENCSLDRVVELELAVYREVLSVGCGAAADRADFVAEGVTP